ncbi:GNAT family N-acetyltransferase [Paenibacillus tarimensis]|uniref:GNAT family N-acetyltransferase n=1 Tax=Paenibacillus tarimensis TaxID=416012 RepID=UPI001F3729C9|nr:GNAT family N-acetyltransferase [Paenibacillus tarimensis]MCF2946067.1 GNAT family N-acetyltransferase [Paenibacillus tarimensis]
MDVKIMEISDGQTREQIAALSGEIMVSRGRVHRLRSLPGYVVRHEQELAGCILYYMANSECEIVSLDSQVENRGIGTKLIQSVIERAKRENCKRIWLITSNDNIRAIRFYQKRGFDMAAVHRNAITEARIIKPTIPLLGYDDIPVKHEVEFELLL